MELDVSCYYQTEADRFIPFNRNQSTVCVRPAGGGSGAAQFLRAYFVLEFDYGFPRSCIFKNRDHHQFDHSFKTVYDPSLFFFPMNFIFYLHVIKFSRNTFFPVFSGGLYSLAGCLSVGKGAPVITMSHRNHTSAPYVSCVDQLTVYPFNPLFFGLAPTVQWREWKLKQ